MNRSLFKSIPVGALLGGTITRSQRYHRTFGENRTDTNIGGTSGTVLMTAGAWVNISKRAARYMLSLRLSIIRMVSSPPNREAM